MDGGVLRPRFGGKGSPGAGLRGLRLGGAPPLFPAGPSWPPPTSGPDVVCQVRATRPPPPPSCGSSTATRAGQTARRSGGTEGGGGRGPGSVASAVATPSSDLSSPRWGNRSARRHGGRETPRQRSALRGQGGQAVQPGGRVWCTPWREAGREGTASQPGLAPSDLPGIRSSPGAWSGPGQPAQGCCPHMAPCSERVLRAARAPGERGGALGPGTAQRGLARRSERLEYIIKILWKDSDSQHSEWV